MGYNLEDVHPSRVMQEIAKVVPGYAGVTYARLERGDEVLAYARRVVSRDGQLMAVVQETHVAGAHFLDPATRGRLEAAMSGAQ